MSSTNNNATAKKNQRCFQECPLVAKRNRDVDCWKICVYENSVCNGIIDMRSQLDLAKENATAFYSLER